MKKLFSCRVLMLVIALSGFAPQFVKAQEIGVQLYTFRAQLAKDLRGTLQQIKSMGIVNLEGGGTYGMSREAYKALLDSIGLRMISWGGDFNQLQTNPQKIIDDAKFFGAKYVVCFWIPHNNNEFTLDDTKKAVSVFNTAGKKMYEAGLELCYHPHGYEFRPNGNENLFDYLVKNTDKRYLNFEMDVFWIKHPGQDPVALMQKYPDRFKLVHLKDRKIGTEGNQNGQADVETNVVLGTGDVGIAAVVQEAKKRKIKYAFIEDESSRSMEQVPQSLRFLSTLNKGR